MSLYVFGIIIFSGLYFLSAWGIIQSRWFPEFYWTTYTAIWLLMISSLFEMIAPLSNDVYFWIFMSRVLEYAALGSWALGMWKNKTEVKP